MKNWRKKGQRGREMRHISCFVLLSLPSLSFSFFPTLCASFESRSGSLSFAMTIVETLNEMT